ncbi:hypothetical protein [Achromobacter aegrifaciens]
MYFVVGAALWLRSITIRRSTLETDRSGIFTMTSDKRVPEMLFPFSRHDGARNITLSMRDGVSPYHRLGIGIDLLAVRKGRSKDVGAILADMCLGHVADQGEENEYHSTQHAG